MRWIGNFVVKYRTQLLWNLLNTCECLAIIVLEIMIGEIADNLLNSNRVAATTDRFPPFSR
jgi:hypothetical protein